MTRIKANPFAISGAVIVLLGLYFLSQWHTHTVQITHPGPATHPGHPLTPITPPNPPLQEDTGVDTGDVGVVGFDAGEERGRVVLVTGLTYDKTSVFEGIDGWYNKVWENREAYARLHGTQPPRIAAELAVLVLCVCLCI